MKGKKAPVKVEGKAIMASAKKPGPMLKMGKADPGDIKVEDGTMGKRRIDRPGRKMGGRIGADSAPLSAAAATKRRGC